MNDLSTAFLSEGLAKSAQSSIDRVKSMGGVFTGESIITLQGLLFK
ncbi:hypothetical protein [Variovorax sp. HJSM1_2]